RAGRALNLEDIVPIKTIDSYEVEFTGEALEGTGQWGAYVVITAPSANPMHMHVIHPKRRVAADATLLDQQAAEAEAERAAMAIVDRLRS
ncbi:MAG TPA: hypothetical protein VF774_13325, partial [Pseudoduganella sp.]